MGGSVMRTLLVQVREGRDVDYTGAVDTARIAFQIVVKGECMGLPDSCVWGLRKASNQMCRQTFGNPENGRGSTEVRMIPQSYAEK